MGIQFKARSDLTELQERLEAAVSQMRSGAVKGVSKTVNDAVAKAKRRAPAVTGALRDSITGAVSETGGQVVGVFGTDIRYGPSVEFGTGGTGQAAKPYLYPAFAAAGQELTQNITEAIKKEMGE